MEVIFTGPNGSGVSVDPNIPITSNQVVYYFTNTSVLPNCTSNLNYNIVIHPTPLVDNIPDGPRCREFVLFVLLNGTYYTLSGGPTAFGQQQLFAGDIIDLSGTHLNPGTYYVYNEQTFNNPDGSVTLCSNEDSFTISINPFPCCR